MRRVVTYYTLLGRLSFKRERDVKYIKSLTYILELASGLLIVERILKEMRAILVNKAEYNNQYIQFKDLLKMN